VLDSKDPNDQEIIAKLPKIAEYLDDSSKVHFAAVLAALDACGVRYEVNPRLVRGLDYYTRTTFEFTHGGLGAQNALLGGGRYDGLSEAIGGPKAPGIGFAMGEDRLILTLEAQATRTASLADAYVAPMDEGLNAGALELTRELRRAGLRVELGDGSFRLKKSFEMGNKLARKIILLGDSEMESNQLTIKNFSTKEQRRIDRKKLLDHAKQKQEIYWRIPKVDDLVYIKTSPNFADRFRVLEVYLTDWAVDLRLIDSNQEEYGPPKKRVRWSDIDYLDELSQAGTGSASEYSSRP